MRRSRHGVEEQPFRRGCWTGRSRHKHESPDLCKHPDEVYQSSHLRKRLRVASRLNGPAPLATNKVNSRI
jgi:hypothetical protein